MSEIKRVTGVVASENYIGTVTLSYVGEDDHNDSGSEVYLTINMVDKDSSHGPDEEKKAYRINHEKLSEEMTKKMIAGELSVRDLPRMFDDIMDTFADNSPKNAGVFSDCKELQNFSEKIRRINIVDICEIGIDPSSSGVSINVKNMQGGYRRKADVGGNIEASEFYKRVKRLRSALDRARKDTSNLVVTEKHEKMVEDALDSFIRYTKTEDPADKLASVDKLEKLMRSIGALDDEIEVIAPEQKSDPSELLDLINKLAPDQVEDIIPKDKEVLVKKYGEGTVKKFFKRLTKAKKNDSGKNNK